MRKFISLFALLVFTLTTFAQATDIITEKTTIEIFLGSTLSFTTGVLSFLLAEATRYMFAGEFNAVTFFDMNVKPFLYTFAGGLIIVAVVVFLPNFVPFLQAQVGEPITLEYESLIMTGAIVGSIIKGFLKRKDTK